MLTCDPILGWLCFYCDIAASRPSLHAMYNTKAGGSSGDGGFCDQSEFQFTILPRDSFRKRMYIAVHDLHVEVEGVRIESAVATQSQVELSLIPFEGRGILRSHLTFKHTAGSGSGTTASVRSVNISGSAALDLTDRIGPFRCRVNSKECEQDRKHGKYVVVLGDKGGVTKVEISI